MFEEVHENLDGLRRVFAGDASQVEADRVASHLTGCRECWLLATRAIAFQKGKGGIPVHGPLRSLIDLHDLEQARLEDWLEAQVTWAEIRSLTTKARREKVRLTRSLHTVSFLEVLLEEGTACAVVFGIVQASANSTLDQTGPRGGATTSLKSGLLRKTVYFYSEEWKAIEEEAIRRGNRSGGSEIVREAVRDYLKIDAKYDGLPSP